MGGVIGLANGMLDDLAMFGVIPDEVRYQEADACEIETLFGLFGYIPPPQAFAPNRGAAEVVGIDCPPYPFVEGITAAKVAFDLLDGVTWCIRGIDLLSEDCLYRYFVERFAIPQPRMTYIPRLQFEGDTVSKTEGNYKLNGLRGADTGIVLAGLAHDCLIDPLAGWTVANVKPRPILGRWANALYPR